MMLKNSRENDLLPKQEAGSKDSKALTSPRSWSGLKNPRIVRVSRLFGGKDRHSKVSTVRGLRDRRVRLSVQTAIQLYDLQDRLGLNQPSKVVDWLLNAAQQEIDKLPPLQMPPGNFFHFSRPSMIRNEATPSQAPSSVPTSKDTCEACGSEARSIPLTSTTKSNNIEIEDFALRKEPCIEKAHIIESEALEDQGVGIHGVHVLSHGMLHNAMPLSSFYHYDPSQEEAAYNFHPNFSPSPNFLASYDVPQFLMLNSTAQYPQAGSSSVKYIHPNLAP